MFDAIISLLFRCSHRRMTRPFTLSRNLCTSQRETYVVCLDCGKEFAYDWKKMRTGKPIQGSLQLRQLPPTCTELSLAARVIPGS